MYETVVIATDGSPSGVRAIETALDLAERFDAAVHALYVVDEGSVDAVPDDVKQDMLGRQRNRGMEALAVVAAQAPMSVETVVRSGDPAAEICEYVEEAGADVVAMGTRGRHGDHSILLGSVAEHVVRSCPAPVLTVRQLGEDEQAAD
jgi:nucleotide-binding universal stress UspA family protein